MKSDIDVKYIKRKIIINLLTKFSLYIIIIYLAIAAFLTILYEINAQFDLSAFFIYKIMRYMFYNREYLIICLFIPAIILIVYFILKIIGYLENMILFTINIFDSDKTYIELPLELTSVERKMNQFVSDFRRNERAAKEAEQRKNDLVVYLAHDLKTPLTSVIGYLTLLKEENQISEELRSRYLSISLDKAERLEDLINEFFEITRFNLTNLSLDISKVNITRLIEQISYEFKPMLEEKQLQCLLMSSENVMVKCDANKIQRVFDNLLRNAVIYSFENSTIKITIKVIEKLVVINIVNNGNTIPEEKLNRIFEQFYRLDSSRDTKTGGSGLGLAIAKEIVELHNGKIVATSENETISFEVTLPLIEQKSHS